MLPRNTHLIRRLLPVLVVLALSGCRGANSGGRFGRSGVQSYAAVTNDPAKQVAKAPTDSAPISSRVDTPPARSAKNSTQVVGRVVDVNGSPVANAKVRLAYDGATAGREVFGETDRNGKFRLSGLKKNQKYTVIAEWEGEDEFLVGRTKVDSSTKDVEIQVDDPQSRSRTARGGESFPDLSSRDGAGGLYRDIEPGEATGAAPARRSPDREAQLASARTALPDPDDDRVELDDPDEARPRRTGWQATSAALLLGAAAARSASSAEPAIGVRSGDAVDSRVADANPLPPARPRETPLPRASLPAPPDENPDPLSMGGPPQPLPIDPEPSAAAEPMQPLASAPASPAPSRIADIPAAEQPVAAAEPEVTSPALDASPVPEPVEEAPAPIEDLPQATPPGSFAIDPAPPPALPATAQPGPTASEPAESTRPDPAAPSDAEPPSVDPPAIVPPMADSGPTAEAPAIAEPVVSEPAEEEPPAITEPTTSASPPEPGAEPPAIATPSAEVAPDVVPPEIIDEPVEAESPQASAVPHPPLTWADLPPPGDRSQPVPIASGRPVTLASTGRGGLAGLGAKLLAPWQGGAVQPVCKFDPRTQRLSEFVLPDLQGKPFKRSQVDSDYMLVVFWGSWSEECVQAISHVEELRSHFDAKSLQVVAIAYERSEPEVRPAIVGSVARRLGLGFPVLIGPTDGSCPLQTALKVEYYPTYLLVDRYGRIQWRGTGATPDTLTRLDRAVNNSIRRFSPMAQKEQAEGEATKVR